MMGCGMSFVKYLLFIFNFVFTLAGLGMLVVGILWKLKVSAVSQYLDYKFSAPPVLLIVVGSIVFIIAFYGCCGAIRESSCMVTTFSVLLMVLLAVGIAVAVVAFVFKDKVEDILTTDFQEAVYNYEKNETSKAAVDTVQEALECCGAAGPRDYLGMNAIPKTCCVTSDGPCTNLDDSAQVYQTGCVAQMKQFIKDSGVIIGSLAVGVSFVMMVGIVFGLCLASSIRKMDRGDFS